MAREWKNISDLTIFRHKECWPMIAPVPEELQAEFEKTGALVVQAHEAVKAMRPILTQRYNIEFPAK
ncbi:MAG TPA: hypothetical protein VN688_21570 [Gemmataceae bacterium]|nr:hypothetical protein [Gemmataceae bacterium]